MRNPKIVVGALASVVILSGIVFWYWTGMAVRAYNPDNLIRFHVIANSDTGEDQSLKLKVRDAVVEGMTPRLKDVQDVAEARQRVRRDLVLIHELAADAVAAAGEDYPVRVYFGHFDFPVRRYGSLELPAGDYEAVRVVIGNGQGCNWWCVLFPPLCFVNAQQDAVPAAAMPAQPVEVRMRLKVVDFWERHWGH